MWSDLCFWLANRLAVFRKQFRTVVVLSHTSQQAMRRAQPKEKWSGRALFQFYEALDRRGVTGFSAKVAKGQPSHKFEALLHLRTALSDLTLRKPPSAHRAAGPYMTGWLSSSALGIYITIWFHKFLWLVLAYLTTCVFTSSQRKVAKIHQFASPWLSACKNPKTVKRIFIKFYIWEFY
jgi:hypothetical protein